jgi:phosphoglycolate phosphatase-like HAD superfamily hydrolase
MAEYKAIVFDVGGTLAVNKGHFPNSFFVLRSETLPQTLEELSKEGVRMFVVSMDSYPLLRQGLFREGLLEPVEPDGSKLRAFDRILNENGLKPSEVLAIGDSEIDEGKAAKSLGIRFIKVQFFVILPIPVPGNKEDLENKLREAFPSILAKKDVMSDASGLKIKKIEPGAPPLKKLVR